MAVAASGRTCRSGLAAILVGGGHFGLALGWIMAGTVPTMIYYSLLALDPSFFYAATCVICAIVALSIGSSWTVAGTIGVALIGAAAGLGLSLEMTAGAIISGGKIFLMLIITAIASLIIGMGLPTTATYIVMASLTAPSAQTARRRASGPARGKSHDTQLPS